MNHSRVSASQTESRSPTSTCRASNITERSRASDAASELTARLEVEPVERFLGYLASIERSLNTIKAYAHDLKDWFVYLGGVGLDWREVSLEDVAGFVGWLRLPPAARDGWVAVLPTVEHYCSESSVNRKLAALTSFCELHARHGVALAGLLVGLTLQIRAGPRRRPDPEDPVLGRPPCTVVGCDRSRTVFGLCSGHDQRWRTRGCPDLAEFNADPGPRSTGAAS